MKKIIYSALFFLYIAVPCLAGQYQVLKVVDGDTIDIMYQGKKERIRMLCVDTPESVHPDQSRNTEMGRKASEYTKSRLWGKYVDLELETKTRGNYGRLLAYVILDGENYNLELVRDGWSKYYTKYGFSERHHVEFMAAEAEAKAKGIGVWASESGSDPPGQPAITGQYHGNIKSHSFHRPRCRHFNCKNCTVVFESRQEAIEAGYRPCGICKP